MKAFGWSCVLLTAFAWAGDEPKPKVSSSVDLKFWGRVFFDVHYDTDDVRGQTDWATYLTSEGGEEVNFNPRDTRFGFSASSKLGGYNTKAVMEIDFHGSNAGNNLLPRLRLGYAEIGRDSWSLRAGQDWIPIATQNPNMVEFGILAWGGNLWWRVPQITYRNKSGDWEFLGSLMKHRISSSQENQEKMPWVLGRAAHSGKNHFFALGLGFRDVDVAGNSYSPYIVCLEFKKSFSSKFSLNGEVWQAAGAAREFVRYGLDYNHEQGEEIVGTGGFLNLTFKPSSKVQASFGIGTDDPKDEDTFLPGTETVRGGVPFVQNTVLYGNIKRQVNKQFGFGFEVMHFETDQTPTTNLSGQRATIGIWYIF